MQLRSLSHGNGACALELRHGYHGRALLRRVVSTRFRKDEQQHTTRATSSQPTPPKKKSHSFYYFDPQDPERVVEVKASGASSKDEASAVAVAGARGAALAPKDAGEIQTALTKATAIQQELLVQLERERGKVMELKQYEGMYKEWRVRAQQASAELLVLQRTLADKDSELASAYKRLENAAAERTALRKHSLSLEEEAKSLKSMVDEVRMLGIGSSASASSRDRPAAAAGSGATAAAAAAGKPAAGGVGNGTHGSEGAEPARVGAGSASAPAAGSNGTAAPKSKFGGLFS